MLDTDLASTDTPGPSRRRAYSITVQRRRFLVANDVIQNMFPFISLLPSVWSNDRVQLQRSSSFEDQKWRPAMQVPPPTTQRNLCIAQLYVMYDLLKVFDVYL